MMRYKIAVAGASQIGHCVKNIKELALLTGKEIAKRNCVLITGATTGVPYFAAQGAKQAGGLSIGFSPAASESEHRRVYRLPLDYFDVIVYTGFDYSGRNLLMTRAADAVIIICGRMGTLNEFTIAFEDQKPIAVLTGSGGTADIVKDLTKGPHRRREKIVFEPTPARLVERLLQVLAQRQTTRSKK